MVKVSRKRQSEIVMEGFASLRVWAENNGIPLVEVHGYPRSIVDKNDVGATVYLFFDTDASVERLQSDGTTARVQQAFLNILETAGYPPPWLEHVTFHVDSRECVERDFEGSYFYYHR
ncbi:hypothetical protein [Catelliglobosispora koreensis]|uniref:hypothetical protein n=1 Tax=Catelliglobosispora koreensis TaxID=129052 RepID=UPI00039B8731|nr:hypothetical protein [Catelliglobosispora koreensis]